MAPKRRDRDRADSINLRGQRCVAEPEEDGDAGSTAVEIRNLLHANNAFERPTRIYQVLRTRQIVRPIFLHRTLTYMRQRMSRNHAKRKNYKVDSILDSIKEHPMESVAKYLTLTFIGYYDPSRLNGGNDIVKVETLVMKLQHHKRKGAPPTVIKLSIGTSEVPINPRDEMVQQVPIISISPDAINVGSTRAIKEFLVMLRVVRDNASESEGNSCTSLEGFLLIYDKKNRNILSDGDYDVRLKDMSNPGRPRLSQPGWTPIGTLDDQDALVPITAGPTIKFRLSWTTESSSGWVDRPVPSLVDITNGDNKENHPNIKSSGLKSHRVLSRSSCSKSRPRKGQPKQLGRPLYYYFQLTPTKSVLTESHRDYVCPWCDVNCMDMHPLLSHLRFCHPRFNFFYTATEDNGVRINVSVNESFNGSYEGNPVDMINHDSVEFSANDPVAFSGDGPVRRAPVTQYLVYRPKRSKFALSEFADIDELDLQRPLITGHNRLYYHTTTCLPIYPQEMDHDSEGEKDPKWLKEKTIMMIDDFTDVNEGEKEIMKMWNLHVMKYGFVGDCQVPLACSMFIDMQGSEIIRKNLYRNMILHLSNLFDFGLLSPPQVYKFTRQLQDVMQTNRDNVHGFAEKWREQRAQWLQSGGTDGSRDKAADKFPPYAVGASNNNPRLASSSTFITGDGTVRRKMTQQSQPVVKKERRHVPASSVSKSAPSHVEDDDDLPVKPKRRLTPEEKLGDEPTKRKRSGSLPNGNGSMQAANGSWPTRRKSSAAGEPPPRKSVAS